MKNSQGNGTVRKLPLWKSLAEELLKDHPAYGKTYDAGIFEEALSCLKTSREFGLAMHNIRMEFELRGFYLQGHAMRENSFVIIPPERNLTIAKAFEKRNAKNRRRAIALLGTTNVALLPKKMRIAHGRYLERLQIRQLLDARSRRIHGYLSKKAPKLLQIGA